MTLCWNWKRWAKGDIFNIRRTHRGGILYLPPWSGSTPKSGSANLQNKGSGTNCVQQLGNFRGCTVTADMHPTTSLSPPPLVVDAWFMYDNSELPRYKFLVMMWQENIPHIPVNCEVRTVTVSPYPVLVAESLLLCLILPDVDNLEPMTAVVSHAEQQESRTFCSCSFHNLTLFLSVSTNL